MNRKPLCELGVAVKKRLIDLNRPQVWLIEEVKKDTGLYFDVSYMGRILTGQCRTPKIVASIQKILGLDEGT